MRTLRRIVFYLFLALYLVATPVTILYALGYLYRPGEEHGLVRTGLVSLKTAPDNARVFVGSSRYRWRTPTMIRDLLPGSYALRLTLRDHQPWSGFVTIEAEKATVLDNVVLLPRDLAPRVLAPGPFDELVAEPGPDWFLVRRGDRAAGLYVYDLDREALRTVGPTNAPLSDAILRRHTTVRGNPFLLMELEDSEGPHDLWCSLDDEDEPALDITRLFQEPPERVTWDRKSKDELFALRRGEVSRLKIAQGAIYPAVLDHVLSFDVHHERLFALDLSNRFVRADLDGKEVVAAGKSPPEVRTFWRNAAGYELRFLDNGVALFRDERGRLLASQPPYELVDAGVEGIQEDPRQEAALVWDRHRIGRLDVRRAEEDDEEILALRWIHTSTPTIRHAQWIHDGSHVLYAADGQLFLLALEEGGGGEPREIGRLRPDSRFFFSERTGCVYGLDDERRLLSIRILPRRELLPRPRARATTAEAGP